MVVGAFGIAICRLSLGVASLSTQTAIDYSVTGGFILQTVIISIKLLSKSLNGSDKSRSNTSYLEKRNKLND